MSGYAEPIRMMLIDNGVEFEDVTFPEDAQWSEIKKQFVRI